jgi:hypothetical protein
MKSSLFPHVVIGMTAVLLGFAASVNAGPPLICHPIDIGQAESLPLVDWNQKGEGNYDVKNLTRDTLAILTPSTPVLVRMETLRRATLFARQDSQVAKELLTRLHMRAVDSDVAGHPDALAWFDFGYLAEAYKQWMGKDEPNPARAVDGYSHVKKAISLRGSDPEMEFAAALITLEGPKNDHQAHLQKALAGSASDPLLARNLASRFKGQMLSEL